jgi:hypothetical protein
MNSRADAVRQFTQSPHHVRSRLLIVGIVIIAGIAC